MKKITQLFATSLFALVIGAGSVSYAQEDHPGYATVVRVQGIASYNLGDGMWHPLIAGKKLAQGAVIRTGEDGIVDVVLGKQIAFPQAQKEPDRITPAPDGAVRGLISDVPSVQQNAVRLTPGTILAIDKLTVNDTGVDTVSDTELDLQKGRIFGTVKKLTAASQYLVKIPNGIAGIRGTEFELGADDSAACYASKSHGFTLVLTIGGETVSFEIEPGEMLEPGTLGGQKPQKIPITPEIELLLEQTFAALSTTLHVVVNYAVNGNCLYISSVTGAKFPSKIVIPPPSDF